MDGLRWLLLFFGLVVVVGVYLYSRREQKPQKETESFERLTPTLDGEDADSGDDVGTENNVLVDEAAQAHVEQKIVTRSEEHTSELQSH